MIEDAAIAVPAVPLLGAAADSAGEAFDGALTTRVIGAVWVRLPLVPVTVSG